MAARSRSVCLQAGGVQLHLFVSDRSFDALQNLEAQFGQTDGDNNEYVDRDEALRNFFLSRVFSAADADGDGKLYIAELESYLDRQRDMMGARLTASVRDLGGPLFMALDTNSDHQLGLAEQQAAASRLATLNLNHDDGLKKAELPVFYELQFARAQPKTLRNFYVQDDGDSIPISP